MTESNIIFYSTPNGQVNVQMQYEDGSFWLTQKRMAELFGVDVRTINEHLQNIYNSGELRREATIRKIRIVQREGDRDATAYRTKITSPTSTWKSKGYGERRINSRIMALLIECSFPLLSQKNIFLQKQVYGNGIG